jgi:hypothetical protein
MPSAPIYGQGGGRPLSYSSYDIMDEPSQQVVGQPSMGRSAAFGGAGAPRIGGSVGSAFGRLMGPGGSYLSGGRLGGGRNLPMPGPGNVRGEGWNPSQPQPTRDLRTDAEFWDRMQNDPLGGATNLEDPIRSMIRFGGMQGVFGKNYLTNLMRKRAVANADAGRRRTSTLAQLSGLDPMQYRGAMVDADIAGNQGTVGALNDAEMQDAEGYQAMIRDFLNRERYGVEVPSEAANVANRYASDRQKQDFWGGLAGQAVGAGAGALLGG